MPLADDIELLRRPIGFAVGINREETIEVAEQRVRLPGLLQFVRTFASEVLEKEFAMTIEGYPHAAVTKTRQLRATLRARGATQTARQLLSALIDLMETEAEYEDASPEDDPDEQENVRDSILVLIGRLLERFAAWAKETGHLPELASEAQRGVEQWHLLADRLQQ